MLGNEIIILEHLIILLQQIILILQFSQHQPDQTQQSFLSLTMLVPIQC